MRRQIRSSFLLAAAAALILHACGGDVMAPDAVIPNQGVDKYLDRVANNCGNLELGNQTVAYLLDVNNNDAYFVDISSKLYFDRVTETQYREDINSQYPTGTNQRALDCIIAQLDGG
jgi:hypothetical protein